MHEPTLKISQPSSYIKAIYATIIGFLSSLATVMVGDVTVGQITQGQWIVAVLAALIAGGGVMGLTNKPVSA